MGVGLREEAAQLQGKSSISTGTLQIYGARAAALLIINHPPSPYFIQSEIGPLLQT